MAICLNHSLSTPCKTSSESFNFDREDGWFSPCPYFALNEVNSLRLFRFLTNKVKRKKGDAKFGRFIKIAYLCRDDGLSSCYDPYHPYTPIWMTIRTFQHRVTAVGMTVPIVTAVLALFFLWHRTPIHIIIGLGLVLVVVILMERLLHTRYELDGDALIIRKGRFDKVERIDVKEITRITRIRRQWLCLDYLLISYGAGHETAVQPQNEEAFLKEIKRRQDDHETDSE